MLGAEGIRVDRPPPRISIILARDVDVGVVFARGPSDWYRLFRWNMNDDRFETGAWFHGRIYVEKSDLSPNGSLLVYSAHKGSALSTPYTDCWTAVSRAPWLAALALWPAGTTYGGGGRFSENRRVMLRLRKSSQPHPAHPPRGLEVQYGSCSYHTSTREVAGADWTCRDRQGRLIFAKEGVIYRGDEARAKAVAAIQPCDPDPQSAPQWASRPLAAKRA